MTEKQYETIAEMLCSNGLDWYAVIYDDSDDVVLKHATTLSNILQCGHDAAEYGIEKMYRCGASDIDEAYDWLGEF